MKRKRRGSGATKRKGGSLGLGKLGGGKAGGLATGKGGSSKPFGK